MGRRHIGWFGARLRFSEPFPSKVLCDFHYSATSCWCGCRPPCSSFETFHQWFIKHRCTARIKQIFQSSRLIPPPARIADMPSFRRASQVYGPHPNRFIPYPYLRTTLPPGFVTNSFRSTLFLHIRNQLACLGIHFVARAVMARSVGFRTLGPRAISLSHKLADLLKRHIRSWQ